MSAEGTDTITTTLTDGAVFKGSKKTFDVFASDSDGNKIASSVTLNGEPVPVNWDDSEKTSYTLTFTEEGENIIVITAGDAEKTITVTYQHSEEGDVTGKAIYAIELFTLGCNYLIPPTYVDIIEGENAAQALLKLLNNYGYDLDYTGELTSGFYLSGVKSADSALDVTANIPDYLMSFLDENGYNVEDDYDENWLGEFDYTYGSGWMYTLNNVLPNVGFADSYLTDGDVVRVQFTLAYGADLGHGFFGSWYTVANRDRLTALIAEVSASNVSSDNNVKAAIESAINIISVLNIDADEINSAYTNLYTAYKSALSTGCSHSSTEWKIVEEPTFDADGKMQEICKSCQKVVNEKSIDKLIRGDIDGNGKIEASDLVKLKLALIGTEKLTDAQQKAYDVTEDGVFDLKDFIRIKKILAGISVN